MRTAQLCSDPGITAPEALSEVLLVNSTKAWLDKDNPLYKSSGQGPGVFEPTATAGGKHKNTTGDHTGSCGHKRKGLNKAESGGAKASSKTFTKEVLGNVEPEYILDICSGYQSCAKYYFTFRHNVDRYAR